MGDIEQAIATAWKIVRPKLENDPVELRRRLARWPRMLAKHWPREWCYAIRAGDTRLNEAMVAMKPERARYVHREHEVTFDARALVRLCALVTIKSVPAAEAAALLGRSGVLQDPRLNGTLRVRHIPPIGGRGFPIPLLSSEVDLDPSARGLQPPDPLWGETAVGRCPSLRMVDELAEQPLRRVPHHVGRGPGVDDDALHPEHPRRDGPPGASRRMPAPEPDLVWYKWKDGQYLGYDWRRPGAKKAYERHERRKAQHRACAKRRREAGKDRVRTGRGSLIFLGWRWICPICQERVQTIYHRAPAVIAGCINDDLVARLKEAARQVKVPESFACGKCHRIMFCGVATPDLWNVVISFLSGGLLYGSDVKRPAWMVKRRKRAYRPQVHREAPRRAQVQELLLRGLTYKQIAATLGMSHAGVQRHAHKVHAMHRVSGGGRLALATALGVELRPGTVVRSPQQGGMMTIGGK
jgi:DNA-binding CsgD family transcriptional regulator